MDVVRLRIVGGWAFQRFLVARSGVVYQTLNNGRVGHSESGKEEAHGDAGDGTEWDADSA